MMFWRIRTFPPLRTCTPRAAPHVFGPESVAESVRPELPAGQKGPSEDPTVRRPFGDGGRTEMTGRTSPIGPHRPVQRCSPSPRPSRSFSARWLSGTCRSPPPLPNTRMWPFTMDGRRIEAISPTRNPLSRGRRISARSRCPPHTDRMVASSLLENTRGMTFLPGSRSGRGLV